MPVLICVPVRNEERTLPALLTGLADQQDAGLSLHLCVALDACTDRSAMLIGDWAKRSAMTVHVQSSRRGEPNAGRARGAAMAMALDLLGGSDGLLLTTDADSVPAPDWISCARRALAIADVVAGRIVRSPGSSIAQDRVEAYYDRLYALRRRIDAVSWEPEPGHHHTGGANLAMHAAAYRALGGFAPIAAGEDARLVDEARRAGFRVRHDAALVVHTSSRRSGRAPAGLASALRMLDEADKPILVDHPADVTWQYQRHALARAAFDRLADPAARAALGAALALSGDHVLGVARDCPNPEAFAMRVVPAPPGGMRCVTLAEAETALAALVAAPEPAAA